MKHLFVTLLLGSAVLAPFAAHTQSAHEMLAGVPGGVDVLSGKRFDLAKELRLPAKASVIIELEAAR